VHRKGRLFSYKTYYMRLEESGRIVLLTDKKHLVMKVIEPEDIALLIGKQQGRSYLTIGTHKERLNLKMRNKQDVVEWESAIRERLPKKGA